MSEPTENNVQNTGNPLWSSSSSFEAIPSVNYFPKSENEATSKGQTNLAFAKSNQSVQQQQPQLAKNDNKDMLLRPVTLPKTQRQTSYPVFIVPPKIKKIKKPKTDSWFKTKILDHPKRKILFIVFVCILLLILIGVLGFIIFAALKPCALTKCHSKASVCINRFPFWAHCICDPGFVGNGKAYCAECGKQLITPSVNTMRIVGGSEAVKYSWPFAVYIIQNYKGRYHMKGSNYLISYTWSCGGTIINQKTILTAAHCIHDKSFEYHDADENYYTLQIQWNEWYNDVESTLEIHVGAHDIKSLEPSKRYRVRKVTKHEEFDEFNLRNDIAVIQIEGFIESTVSTQYACLPFSFSNEYPSTNSTTFIVGWGRTSEKGYSSNILRNSKINVYEFDKCLIVEKDILKNWNTQICAGALDGSTDTCQGDSGGGLFFRDRLDNNNLTSRVVVAGVVSYGEGCSRVGKPGIYSRTSHYLEWIQKNSDF